MGTSSAPDISASDFVLPCFTNSFLAKPPGASASARRSNTLRPERLGFRALDRGSAPCAAPCAFSPLRDLAWPGPKPYFCGEERKESGLQPRLSRARRQRLPGTKFTATFGTRECCLSSGQCPAASHVKGDSSCDSKCCTIRACETLASLNLVPTMAKGMAMISI